MSVGYDYYERACYVCGKRSMQMDWCDSRLPAYDLDCRPTRNGHWDLDDLHMQYCSHCGYVSSDISRGEERDDQIVNSPEFQQVRDDDRFPERGRLFLGAALLVDDTHQGPAEAAADRSWWQMVAAWSSEDEGDMDAGRVCREMATKSMMECRTDGSHVFRDPDVDLVVIADNLRRCEKVDAALKWIDNNLEAVTDIGVRAQLEFERSLVMSRDVAPHRVDETPGLHPGRVDMLE